jgi:hypothetical protein
MPHPRDSAPIQEQMEAKLKSLLLNFCYKLYLQKKSDSEVLAAIAAKDLPRMTRQDWWNLKHWFRQREMSAPAQMASIRRKIGMTA